MMFSLLFVVHNSLYTFSTLVNGPFIRSFRHVQLVFCIHDCCFFFLCSIHFNASIASLILCFFLFDFNNVCLTPPLFCCSCRKRILYKKGWGWFVHPSSWTIFILRKHERERVYYSLDYSWLLHIPPLYHSYNHCLEHSTGSSMSMASHSPHD